MLCWQIQRKTLKHEPRNKFLGFATYKELSGGGKLNVVYLLAMLNLFAVTGS